MKTAKAKSPYDQAIYNEARSLLEHGYFESVAKRYRLEGKKVRRIMLGYYDPSDGTHKAIRDEILSKVAAIKHTKAAEIRRLGVAIAA